MIYESPALQGISGSSAHVYLVYQVASEKNLGSRIIFTTDWLVYFGYINLSEVLHLHLENENDRLYFDYLSSIISRCNVEISTNGL